MAYASTAPRAFAFTALPASTRQRGATPTKPRGLFRRLFDAMTNARQLQAEYEVARYLEGTGGKFTDEAEREITRRLMSNSNSSRW